MSKIEDNEFMLRCACGNRFGHSAWLIHEPDSSRGNNLKGEDDDWYLMVGLDPHYGFWRRLVVAWRYLLGLPVTYWGYAELVLRTQDIAELEEFIMRRRNP